MSEESQPTKFVIRVDDGAEQEFVSHDSRYSIAALAAFGALKLPYPCTVEIWIPELVEAGYGPYKYRIDDFDDGRGNTYGCPSAMQVFSRP